MAYWYAIVWSGMAIIGQKEKSDKVDTQMLFACLHVAKKCQTHNGNASYCNKKLIIIAHFIYKNNCTYDEKFYGKQYDKNEKIELLA